MPCSTGKQIQRKIFYLLLIVACFFGVSVAEAQTFQVSLTENEKRWLGEHPTIRLGVGIAFPPFMWVQEEDGQPTFKGMVSDYITLLEKRLGVDMQVVFNIPFNEALARGQAGQIDFFPCLSRTPGRSEYLLFTEPYLSYPLVVITREDAPIIGDLKDLAGKRFAAVEHLVVYSKLKNEYSHLNFNYVFTKKVEENLEEISLGRADACIINLAVASYYIQKKGLTNLRIAAPVNWKGVQLGMGVRKDWPILHGIIKKGLASISQEEKDQISQKWIRTQYKPGVAVNLIFRWALGVGLCILVVFALIIMWNQRLRKEMFEREKVQANLKESERKLSTLIGNLPGIVYRCLNDEAWTMQYMSNGCKALTGYDPSELIENHFLAYGDLIVQADRRYVKDQVRAAVNENRSFILEYRIRDKNNNERWFWEKGRCVSESKGQPSVLEGFISDITERKKAETSTLEEKKRAEQYLQLAGVMFIGLDKKGNINVANKKACQILEIQQKEILGQNWFDNFIPQSDRHEIYSVFRQLIDGIIEPVEYYENSIITKNGKEKRVAWHNTVLRDDDGSIIGVLSSGEDITEKKHLQTELQQAQKMESIGTLAGGIAHDFNNILSAIIGFTELSLDSVEKGTDLEDNLQEVRTAGMRAKELVKQILTFARQSDEAVKPIQINIIAKEVLKLIKPSIPATIQINDKINSDSFITGSPTQIHQVLMNLCTNAAHAMEENGGILEVSVNDTTIDRLANPDLKSGEYIEIKVTDTGMGISPQHIHTIFEPYFTTKTVSEGTGMGLAVVHGIVENYSGQITADSTPGKGTCFTVYLPIAKKRKTQIYSEKQDLPHGNESILFVDDEAPIARVGGEILKKLGYTVTTRTSSVDSLELFRSEPQAFDLVITDMTMPNLTGDNLAVEMMKIRSNIPVILCTGYSKKISEKSAVEMGIRSLIYKPIVKADLARTVRKVLNETKRSS